jgi:hypothetical protein
MEARFICNYSGSQNGPSGQPVHQRRRHFTCVAALASRYPGARTRRAPERRFRRRTRRLIRDRRGDFHEVRARAGDQIQRFHRTSSKRAPRPFPLRPGRAAGWTISLFAVATRPLGDDGAGRAVHHGAREHRTADHCRARPRSVSWQFWRGNWHERTAWSSNPASPT